MSEGRPPGSRRSPSNQSSAATLLALFGLLLIGGGLLGLTALVLPFVWGFVIVAMLFIVPIAFHYLVWGWWMSQMKDEPPDDE